MRRETLEVLACPECHGRLEPPDHAVVSLACTSCGARFAVDNDVPRLVPRGGRDERWGEWDEKQALGLIEYEQSDPPAGYFHDVAVEFGHFAELHGTVLDVGCGIGDAAPYVPSTEVANYIGLDPLDGRGGHGFDFIQGIGEQLPIRDAVFDYVVSATSLDHVVEPDRVLSEARRVLKPGGRLALWIAVVDEDAILHCWWRPPFEPRAAFREGGLRRLLGSLWYWSVQAPRKRLVMRVRFRFAPDAVTRDLYADRMRYHFHFFRRVEIENLVAHCGFTILKQRLVESRDYGDSLFVLASPTEKP
jgi:SAM-dependent methyltransferase